MNGIGDFFFGPAPIIWFQRALEPIGPLPFHALSLLGDTWGLLLVLGISFWLWGRHELYPLLPLVAIEAVSYLLLNQILSIPRPSDASITSYETLSISAFPSGHTYLATILWGFLWKRGRVPLWLAIGVVGGVAVGRLFLGVHHIGDLVGAIVLGALLVAVYDRMEPRLLGWLRERSSRVLTLASAAVGIAAVVALPFLGENARWFAVAGLLTAAAVALPLEHRGIGFRGIAPRRKDRILGAGIGLAGIAIAYAVREVLQEPATFIAALTAAATVLWIFIAVPLALRRLRLERLG